MSGSEINHPGNSLVPSDGDNPAFKDGDTATTADKCRSDAYPPCPKDRHPIQKPAEPSAVDFAGTGIPLDDIPTNQMLGTVQITADAIKGAAKVVAKEATQHPVRFALEVGGAVAAGVAVTAASPVLAAGAAAVGAGEAVVAGAAAIGSGIEAITSVALTATAIDSTPTAVRDLTQGLNKSKADIDIVMNPTGHTANEVAVANSNIQKNLGQPTLEAGEVLAAAGGAATGILKTAGRISSTVGDIAAVPKITPLPDGGVVNEWAVPTKLGSAYDNMTVTKVTRSPRCASE